MSKILITGGYGFIGYHLARKLSEDRHSVVLANNPRKEKALNIKICQ